MIRLPIGENFERFVDWLKASFDGVFELLSEILDFSITLLENVLLLDSEAPGASVLFGLVLALVFGLLARQRVGRRWLLPAALGTAVLFGAAESWRLGRLGEEVDVTTAAAVRSDFTLLKTVLEERAPTDFNAAEAAIARAMEASTVFVEPGEDALRDIRRARSAEFDEVADALGELIDLPAQAKSTLSAAHRAELREQRARFRLLTLIEESERLIDDLDAVGAGEDFERKNEFLNSRTFAALDRTFTDSREAFGEEPDLGPALAAAHRQLKSLDPDRFAAYPPLATMLVLLAIAGLIAGRGIVLFALLGFPLILSMGMWVSTMETLALVLSATFFALLIGVPTGIATARSALAEQIVRPILDFMQTMPAFVYLIPAVIFFGLGKVPGAMATLIFAMPPAVRLTSLGIRQVPKEVVEAVQSFGATGSQLLFKAQLPIAMATILAGVNQTIMLALSMVVIGGMIGAGGLGEDVLSGITQMKLGLGFEGGIAVVILAIYLDRITQALGKHL